jgi:predicted RNase H-like nuclease
LKLLGIELATPHVEGGGVRTLVLLDDNGGAERVALVEGLPAIAAEVGRLADGEPFLLGVDVPVVVPAKAARVRPVESLIRRRFRQKISAGGRASCDGGGLPGEMLMAALATGGFPCLPYPDRDRRSSGLAETLPSLTLKSLLWQHSRVAEGHDLQGREELFRAWTPPAYRRSSLPSRSGWADQTIALETTLAALGSIDGYDFTAVWDALGQASSEEQTENAAALFDAILIGATAKRYLEAPESCLFAGEREDGYVIAPADSLMRRLWLSDNGPVSGELFPQASLRERLGSDARLRTPDLLAIPGRASRIEATFNNAPLYEFDNVDEMLWWKHCRHLAGPKMPVNGLQEILIELDVAGGKNDGGGAALRLVRSRHQALSFRFDHPEAWRRQLPTRDNRTYPFRVVRALYETAPGS